MNLQIMILNTMKYEKDGTNRSRLAYIIPNTESFSDTEKFRGYSELSAYRNDSAFYDKIPIEFIGQKCSIKIEEKPSKLNPMKSYKEIVEVSCNGKIISLV